MPDDSTYMALYIRLMNDVAEATNADPTDLVFDIAYVVKRMRDEGMSFFTKTLPGLGKAVDYAFQSGTFEPVPSFKREKGRTTPMFFRGLFKAVFDGKGQLLENPCPAAVGHLRQLCFIYYKLEDTYTPETVQRCIDDFCAVDEDLANVDLSAPELRPVIVRAKQMITRIFGGFDYRDIIPRPGPGASASGTHKVYRYEMKTHFDQVHQVFPMYDYFYLGKDHLLDRVGDYRKAPRVSEPESSMRMVPKDSRGPRIICMEEQEVMFLQQGLADKMRARLESHSETSGRVNFTDQTINQQLAKNASLASIDVNQRQRATLDMKEASDRVSRQLVATLFGGTTLLRGLLALSTRLINLPDGRKLRTLKFAPMGSSLCFPVMSIVHYALGRAIIAHVNRNSVAIPADCMYVYGDDIIVDTQHVAALFEWFPKFGLKFNQNKSFWQGPFRESCGFDAFLGRNVSPQRIKNRFFDSPLPTDVMSAIDCERLLYEKGYLRAADYLRTVFEHRADIGDGRLPFVHHDSPALGWRRSCPTEFDLTPLNYRYSHDYQCREVCARVLTTEPTVSFAGGWEQLVRHTTGVLRATQRVAGTRDPFKVGWTWLCDRQLTTAPPKLEWLRDFV